MENQTEFNQQQVPVNMPQPTSPKKSRVWLAIALATLFVTGNVAAWALISNDSDSNNNQQPTAQENVVTTTKLTEEAVPEESTEPAVELVPAVELAGNTGQIVTSQIRKENGNIYFDYYVGAGFTEAWVEYGVDQENLTEKTKPETGGLGMVFSDVFGGWSAVITEKDLPTNENDLYFYRGAGTYEGKTIYGGVVGFSHK